MRIQIILILILISVSAFAVDDKSMQELFTKYDSVMLHKKVELIDEVFTQKFITDSGGKKAFIDKIKNHSISKKESQEKTKFTWRKGVRGKNYFAKVKDSSDFVIVEENGKLKINGTISDGN